MKSATIRRSAALAPLLVGLLGGCGIPSTGVLNSGAPATGLIRGMRVYFATDAGLRAVSRPSQAVEDLQDALKLLSVGPSKSERASGMTNLLESIGGITASGTGEKITVVLSEAELPADDNLRLGQLVCTLARAQSVLHKEVRPDTVQVTVRTPRSSLGPYQCPFFIEQ
ncbi:hypothetical protein [Streptomyces sp. x-80]|uniref:hypothetical protein n=1 Tax=Streptomyces sp. x-80 TaxID=2789282 RepID=UPI00397FC71B